MAKRPTIDDLARAANVSTATVDRVINGRHKVREDTTKRVCDAAHEIGYHAAGLIKQRIQENLSPVKFGFILQKPQQYFYQQFAEKLAEAVRVNVDI
uniref:HTH lacI-type domain-containing protein n=1 Tax=OCS116 cluster bacterium TaxID=2030921 RepID=A0A2A4ZB64_9PROT